MPPVGDELSSASRSEADASRHGRWPAGKGDLSDEWADAEFGLVEEADGPCGKGREGVGVVWWSGSDACFGLDETEQRLRRYLSEAAEEGEVAASSKVADDSGDGAKDVERMVVLADDSIDAPLSCRDLRRGVD